MAYFNERLDCVIIMLLQSSTGMAWHCMVSFPITLTNYSGVSIKGDTLRTKASPEVGFLVNIDKGIKCFPFLLP